VSVFVATLAFAAAGAACLWLSSPKLSATFDESNHLAAGLEWWQSGSYQFWTEDPPLGRAAVAAVPYWKGMRLARPLAPPAVWIDGWLPGVDLLHGPPSYDENLRRARLGVFPFFLLTLALVWSLANGARRPLAGLIAVGLTATLPLLVAHGALATTDVPFTATLLMAVLAAVRWLEEPTFLRAGLLGLAVALAALTSFSALLFFPAALVALLAARLLAGLTLRPSRHAYPLDLGLLAGHLATGVAAMFLVIWAGYRFSWGRIDELPAEIPGWLAIFPPADERGGLWQLIARSVPFPEFFHGLIFLSRHDDAGQSSYLMGEVSQSGFRLFYPIGLAFKTPLTFLGLGLLSVPFLIRRARRSGSWQMVGCALAALGILIAATFDHLDLGMRHVLPIFPLLAAAAAGALASALEPPSPARRAVLGLLVAGGLLGQVAITVRAHPNQLSYFNELAPDPGSLLLSADLDWGQGLFQLRDEARRRGIDELKIAYFGMERACRLDLPNLKPLLPGKPAHGWIALSENFYRERSNLMLLRDPCQPGSSYPRAQVPPHPFAWLRGYKPETIVAGSIRLYRIPDSERTP
jgi:4-amino-4-deoxy-L-arabinose transferase-like glycosyltransferase